MELVGSDSAPGLIDEDRHFAEVFVPVGVGVAVGIGEVADGGSVDVVELIYLAEADGELAHLATGELVDVLADERGVDGITRGNDVLAVDVAEVERGVEVASDGTGKIVLRGADWTAIDAVPGIRHVERFGDRDDGVGWVRTRFVRRGD